MNPIPAANYSRARRFLLRHYLVRRSRLAALRPPPVIFRVAGETYIVQDRFDRPDAASLGSAETGQTWVAVSGYSITGGKAHPTVAGGVVYQRLNAGTTNGEISVKVTLNVAEAAGGPVWRSNPSAWTEGYYFALVDARTGENHFTLNRRTAAGGWAILGAWAQAPDINVTYALRVTFQGSSLILYVDGVARITVTDVDATLAAQGGVGLETHRAGAADNSLVRYDDFYVRAA